MNGMMLEEILANMERDALDDAIESAMAASAEAEMKLAIAMAEAVGSVRRLEQLGWFRYRRLPDRFAETLMALAPASRGGDNNTLLAERLWDRHVDELAEEFGYELIERTRAKLDEIIERAESKAREIEQQSDQG